MLFNYPTNISGPENLFEMIYFFQNIHKIDIVFINMDQICTYQ